MRFKLLFVFLMVSQFTFSLDSDFTEYLKSNIGKKINVAIVGLIEPKYYEDRALSYNAATNKSIFKSGKLLVVSSSYIIINNNGLEMIIPLDKIGYISLKDTSKK